MLKKMVNDSGLETDKKLVNHSTRKHLVQKLVDNDIPPNEIIQITGHKNVTSLNNYSTLSLSDATVTQRVSAAGNSVQGHTVSIDETTNTSTCYLPGLSAMPKGSHFQNCKIGTVNVFPSGVTERQPSQIHNEKRRRVIISESDESSQSQ